MPENKGVVHHILIYACTDLNINDTMHGVSWNLFEPMPAMDSCIGIMFGWGIGGGVSIDLFDMSYLYRHTSKRSFSLSYFSETGLGFYFYVLRESRVQRA